MDVTPAIPVGRQYIESYGNGRFRISGVVHPGPVLVFRDRTLPWSVTDPAQLTVDSLAPVVESGDVMVLLVGCGKRMALIAPELRQALRGAGIVIETMDTGGACRTYNVLLAEDRQVAAALMPVE
jgi:uncharacterized protein